MKLRTLAILPLLLCSSVWAQRIPKIIGGDVSRGHGFFLQLSMDGSLSQSFCGSTAIAPGVAVTAAHCIAARTRAFKLVHGINQDGISNLTVFDVDAVIPHPEYAGTKNDIALIFYNEAAHPDVVRPAPINRGQINLNRDSELRAIGRGNLTSIGTVYSSILYEAQIPYISTPRCAEVVPYRGAITDKHLCAGEIERGGIDSCQGDSGGPLVAMVNDRATLVGVTNFGLGCGQKGHPGVYANLQAFAPWIDQNITTYFANERAALADLNAAFVSKCHLIKTVDQTFQQQNSNDQGVMEMASIVAPTARFARSRAHTPTRTTQKVCEFKLGNDHYSATIDLENFGKLMLKNNTRNHWYAATPKRLTDSFYQRCAQQNPGVAFDIAFGDGAGMMNVNGITGLLNEIQPTQMPNDTQAVAACKIGRFETTLFTSQSAQAIMLRLKNHLHDKTTHYVLLGASGAGTPTNAATLSARLQFETATSAKLIIKNASPSDLFTWELSCNKDIAATTRYRTSNKKVFYHATHDAEGTVLSGDEVAISIDFASADRRGLECTINRDIKVTIQ